MTTLALNGKRTAVIWVLDPADYQPPFHEMRDGMELTIVKELVHLELASLPRSEASRGSDGTRGKRNRGRIAGTGPQDTVVPVGLQTGARSR